MATSYAIYKSQGQKEENITRDDVSHHMGELILKGGRVETSSDGQSWFLWNKDRVLDSIIKEVR